MQSSSTHHSLVEVSEEDVMGYLTIALYDGLSKFKVAFRSNTTSKVPGARAHNPDIENGPISRRELGTWGAVRGRGAMLGPREPGLHQDWIARAQHVWAEAPARAR